MSEALTPGLTPGLWEELLTEQLSVGLDHLDRDLQAELGALSDAEVADRLSRHVAAIMVRLIDAYPTQRRGAEGVALVRSVISHLETLVRPDLSPASEQPEMPVQILRAVLRRLPTGQPERVERPLTPLLDTTLLTNARGEPALAHEVRAEVASAEAIDLVMAFIRQTGIRPLLPGLRRHCDEGRRLRILTTSYTGSTEARALDELSRCGAEIKVSYDTGITRLHAKAWIFHRHPTTTTAYIGSSNLTHSAQVSGLEWNVRVSAARNPDVVAKMMAVFDSYWEDHDFVDFDLDDYRRRTAAASDGPTLRLSPLEIELRPFQEALLERIQLSRARGRHRNLLVAATGTGKTVMAAVDYARLARRLPRARLLFVAHREEILQQSRDTFRHALRDASFGELWVDGQRPERFEQVFASVQSLNARGVEAIDPHRFDVVIVDEFHHAAATTYQVLLDHLRPQELLGLTATPERADGVDILHRFDGRIAAELRLWDAIDAGYLVPFSYYGVADGTDLSSVPWRRSGGYDLTTLSNIFTADHVWANRVIAAVGDTVGDPTRMRALGFCVNVRHARFMAERFAAAGIPAVVIWGESSRARRHAALQDLAAGRVAVVFTVDLFNEGIDVPGIDTLLLLRPTDSGTLFLQQLGRGLRRALDKPVCTVIDFVSNHRHEFRYDRRFRALLGGTRRDVERQVAAGFPYLPAGCSIELDAVAEAIVLRSIRSSLPTTWRARVSELRSLGDVTLERYLTETGLELEDVCDGARSWSELRRAAGLPTAPAGPQEAALLRAVGRLLHVDDPVRLETYRRLISDPQVPDLDRLPEHDRRLLRMLIGALTVSTLPDNTPLIEGMTQVWGHPQVRAELAEVLELLTDRTAFLTTPMGLSSDNPTQVHARYTRTEILAAFGDGGGLRAVSWREGVRWLPEAQTDVFAFTLDKTSGSFSPTTRYRDYAISAELIHWETQSATSTSSTRGRRYLTHEVGGSHVVLFARENTAQTAFWCLGAASYVRHQSERPIAIVWRLHRPLPANLYTILAAAVA